MNSYYTAARCRRFVSIYFFMAVLPSFLFVVGCQVRVKNMSAAVLTRDSLNLVEAVTGRRRNVASTKCNPSYEQFLLRHKRKLSCGHVRRVPTHTDVAKRRSFIESHRSGLVEYCLLLFARRTIVLCHSRYVCRAAVQCFIRDEVRSICPKTVQTTQPRHRLYRGVHAKHIAGTIRTGIFCN